MSRLLVMVVLPGNEGSSLIPLRCSPAEPADVVVQRAVELARPWLGEEVPSEADFVLQVPGRRDFVFGPEPLEAFDVVRRCVSRGDHVLSLALCRRSDVLAGRPSWPPEPRVLSGTAELAGGFEEEEAENVEDEAEFRERTSAASIGSSAGSPELAPLLLRDPDNLTMKERALLWERREELVGNIRALTCWMVGAPPDAAALRSQLRQWQPLDLASALFLLGPLVTDDALRAEGVEALRGLSQGQLLAVLPQLVAAAVRCPGPHDGPLSLFLLRRAWKLRGPLGHDLFWLLRERLYDPTVGERCTLLLEAFVRGAGALRMDLERQVLASSALEAVGAAISYPMDRADLVALLGEVQLPPIFQLPCDPRVEVTGLKPNECRLFDSKRTKLWLVFSGGTSAVLVFGDQRPHQASVRLMALMDRLLKEHGLDARLTCYSVRPLNPRCAWVEVVPDAVPLSALNRRFGEAAGGAVVNYLSECAPQEEELQRSFENFAISSAGAAVLLRVLAIGQRWSDNMLVSRAGHLIHIDLKEFGSLYRSKFGLKRNVETVHVPSNLVATLGGMGSERWCLFLRILRFAFLVLRHNADLIQNLLHLSNADSDPEDSSAVDLVCRALLPELSDDQAEAALVEDLYSSLQQQAKFAAVHDVFF